MSIYPGYYLSRREDVKQRFEDRAEVVFLGAIMKWARGVQQDVVDRMERNWGRIAPGALSDALDFFVPATEEIRDGLVTEARPVIEMIFQYGAELAAGDIGVTFTDRPKNASRDTFIVGRSKAVVARISWELILDETRAYLARWRDIYGFTTSATMEAAIRDALRTAIENGASAQQAAESVATVMRSYLGDDYQMYRALRIARTETCRAIVQGERAALRRANVQKMMWITGRDEHVCDTCEPLDQQTRLLDEPFSGGYDGPPAHPNCRCDIIGIIEEGPDIHQPPPPPPEPPDGPDIHQPPPPRPPQPPPYEPYVRRQVPWQPGDPLPEWRDLRTLDELETFARDYLISAGGYVDLRRLDPASANELIRGVYEMFRSSDGVGRLHAIGNYTQIAGFIRQEGHIPPAMDIGILGWNWNVRGGYMAFNPMLFGDTNTARMLLNGTLRRMASSEWFSNADIRSVGLHEMVHQIMAIKDQTGSIQLRFYTELRDTLRAAQQAALQAGNAARAQELTIEHVICRGAIDGHLSPSQIPNEVVAQAYERIRCGQWGPDQQQYLEPLMMRYLDPLIRIR